MSIAHLSLQQIREHTTPLGTAGLPLAWTRSRLPVWTQQGGRAPYFRPEGGLWGDWGDPTGVLGLGNLCQNTQPLQNRREDASEES